jgi:AcrR family transcriptional regulator
MRAACHGAGVSASGACPETVGGWRPVTWWTNRRLPRCGLRPGGQGGCISTGCRYGVLMEQVLSRSAGARPAGSARAPRTPPAQRRQLLLDAAERLLTESGSDALRMDALARAGGVTRPVVYDHFGGRDGLVVALLERHAERVRAHVAAAVTPGAPFEDELRDATRAYLEVARRHGPAVRALVSAQHLSPAIETARRRTWDAAAEHWSGRYREHTGLSRRDADALATAHLAALTALAGLCIEGRLGLARATELHVTSTLAALGSLATRPEELR